MGHFLTRNLKTWFPFSTKISLNICPFFQHFWVSTCQTPKIYEKWAYILRKSLNMVSLFCQMTLKKGMGVEAPVVHPHPNQLWVPTTEFNLCMTPNSYKQHKRCFTGFQAKRKKKSVSKLVTDWKTWPKCVFFLNIFSPLSSRRVKFGSVTTSFSMKYGTWFMDEQDTRQNTSFKKSVVQSVLLCLSCLFMYILTSKFIKTGKKLENFFFLNEKLEFCLIKCAPKNRRAQQLRHNFFLA